jgi:hypothetical protein
MFLRNVGSYKSHPSHPRRHSAHLNLMVLISGSTVFRPTEETSRIIQAYVICTWIYIMTHTSVAKQRLRKKPPDNGRWYAAASEPRQSNCESSVNGITSPNPAYNNSTHVTILLTLSKSYIEVWHLLGFTPRDSCNNLSFGGT